MRKKDRKRGREKERERDDPVINMQCVKFFLPAKVVTRKKGGHTKQKKVDPTKNHFFAVWS